MAKDKYLTMKEVAKCFKQFDFNEQDAVNVSTLDVFFLTHIFLLEKNGKLEPCCNLFHQRPMRWTSETEIVFEKKLIRDPAIIDMQTVSIDDLRIKDNSVFRETLAGAINLQSESNRTLIWFVKNCCPLVNQALIGRVARESNYFSDNYISLDIAAALLTTWLFLEKRYVLSRSKKKGIKNDLKSLADEEKKQLKRITDQLTLIPQDKKTRVITIDSFIQFVEDNYKNLPVLPLEIEQYYLSLLENSSAYDSMKNTFISQTLLKIIYEALKSVQNLHQLPLDSVMHIAQRPNLNDYTPSKKVAEFAKTFTPNTLKTFAERYNLNLKDTFQQVVAHKIRWFVQLEETIISSLEGHNIGWVPGWPTLAGKEKKEIAAKLKQVPFYKLPQKSFFGDREIDSETSLKNTGKAFLDELCQLELPEELYFLHVQYGYSITIAIDKNLKLLRSEITLDDIIISKNEAVKLCRILEHESNILDMKSAGNKDTPRLSDENLRIFEVGKKTRANSKNYAAKSAEQREEETKEKWAPYQDMALTEAKKAPGKHTATGLAKIIINKLPKNDPNKITDETFRKKIRKSDEIYLFLAPSTRKRSKK